MFEVNPVLNKLKELSERTELLEGVPFDYDARERASGRSKCQLRTT